jgi:tRNA (cmo5U34)-methyltransferase
MPPKNGRQTGKKYRVTDTPQSVDFDGGPPMPVNDYERTVKGVNVGYELLFTLVECFLRAQGRADLQLLVVGAGGGMEIERFLPRNPGWRITGVDPSHDMLAFTQANAEQFGVA